MKLVAEFSVCWVKSRPISLVNRCPPGVVAALLVMVYSTAWVTCRDPSKRIDEKKSIIF